MKDQVSDQKVFECSICHHRFSEEDVKQLLFFPDTGVCDGCYRDGVEQKYENWCFGKTNLAIDGKVVKFGYDPLGDDCAKDTGSCPDRRICPLYANGEIVLLQLEVKQMANGTNGKTEGKTNGKAATAGKSKKPAVAKAAPKEPKVVRTEGNPYTTRSALHPIFEALVKGANLEELTKKAKLDYMKSKARLTRNGRNGFAGFKWTLEDDGNRQKIVVTKAPAAKA